MRIPRIVAILFGVLIIGPCAIIALPGAVELQRFAIPAPAWIEYGFLAGPLTYGLVLSFLRKAHEGVRFALAVLAGLSPAVIGLIYCFDVPAKLPIVHPLNENERGEITLLIGSRFWVVSSNGNYVIKTAPGPKENILRAYLEEHQLLRKP